MTLGQEGARRLLFHKEQQREGKLEKREAMVGGWEAELVNK